MDWQVFWQDQKTITLYHGTAKKKLDPILNKGVVPSYKDYTKGKAFFSTSFDQAWEYAGMGGEVDFCTECKISKNTLEDSERVVIEIQAPPDWFQLSGAPNFQTREAFEKVKRFAVDCSKNTPGMLQLEFTTEQIIAPEYITRVHQK